MGYIIENRHFGSCDSADIAAYFDWRNDGLIEDYRLDLLLERVGELISVGLEYLYAVIFAGVVRGGNHYARIVLVLLHKERHCRGRHDAEEQNICADGAKACADGGLKHLRRCAGIHAYKHAGSFMRAVGEHHGGSSADFHGEFASKLAVCNASCAVCSKKSSHN